ncbi:MAG: PAS domain S-box protein [Chloroflexota bacterium]
MKTSQVIENQQALQQSEARFQSVFKAANDAMSLSDANGMVLEANPAYLELYGYSADEVIGHHFSIIFPEKQRESVSDQYKLVFDGADNRVVYRSKIQRKDGTTRSVETRIAFLMPGGQRSAMLSVIRDITEQERAEQALRIRYELTAALMQAVSVTDVKQVTVEQLTNLLGATSAHIHVYHEANNAFQLLHTSSLVQPEQLIPWQQHPADEAFPITYVVKQQQPLWFSSAQERETAYPSMALYTQRYPGATALLPLLVGGKAFGALSLTFAESRTFDETERAFISSLVHQCAQVIERARLNEAAQEIVVLQERQRLARDLHDSVSQTLFSMTLYADALPQTWERDPKQVWPQLKEMQRMARAALAEMRTLFLELRPAGITKSSLAELFDQLIAAIQGRHKIQISCAVDVGYAFSEDVHIALYRLVQESLNNIVKHSQATEGSISLTTRSGHLELRIRDNGKGFDSEKITPGLGLGGMRERAALIGANLAILSEPGQGTEIVLLANLDPL